MSNFESRFDDILGEDYDFDHDVLQDTDQVAKLRAIVEEMPDMGKYAYSDPLGNRGILYTGWSEEEMTCCEIVVLEDGRGINGFIGSERIEYDGTEYIE